MSVICYADDTLVTAREKTFGTAARLASAGGTLVGRRIRCLCLKVALEKTEALFLPGPRQRTPPDAHIVVKDVRIDVKGQMKYLGLTLDGRWHFSPHFNGLASRLLKAAGALSWPLPNLEGPQTRYRRLYAGVLRSMVLYGAPIWTDALNKRENAALMRRPQRAIAQKVARIYRTVGHAVACVLAGTPSLGARSWDQKARGKRPAPERRGAVRQEEREIMIDRRKEDMTRAQFGCRTLDAIGPVLDQWLELPHGFLTFRLAQVLTDGCFGVGDKCILLCRHHTAEESPLYHKCGAADDTVQHTLAVCTGWEEQRRVLTAVVGRDLLLPSLVNAMLGSEGCWMVVAFFCEEIFFQKEAAERERENDPLASSLRRRRRGWRRRLYDRSTLPTDGGQQAGGAGAPLSPPSDGNGLAFRAIPVGPPQGGRLRSTV
ncbi:uncharacterized protein LOC135072142 [Ostrinia nubilalis]|uniref:uncharacterized protein LOC135072142 n=1 Tax=Ostrinia nubilalis TaxID=29057 RepID=UPI0030824CC5